MVQAVFWGFDLTDKMFLAETTSTRKMERTPLEPWGTVLMVAPT